MELASLKFLKAGKVEKAKKYYAEISALFVFLIYVTTLSPSIAPIDAGELATVQILPGIAHPTGYPLFTVTGYLFSFLPLFASKIYQMNFLAALWSALAVYFFIKSAEMIFDFNLKEKAKKEAKRKKKKNFKSDSLEKFEIDETAKIVSILFGAFLLAFSKTFWLQSTSVEVYSLQTLLFSLIIFAILKAATKEKPLLKNWLFVATALALGFANHMTTLLLLPGLALLYFYREEFTSESFRKIGVMLLLFFPLLALLYAYLPLRAAAKPLLNWSNPVNFENFWRHFTGRQYQVWLFSSWTAAKKQFVYFLSNFPSEFGYVAWLVALIGLFASYRVKKLRPLFWFFLVNFLFTVLYSINYDIHDIDSYFLLAYFSVAFFAVYGTARILTLKNFNRYLRIEILLALLFTEGILNYSKANQSDYYVLEDYTKSILSAVEPNAIILTYQWDYFVSPSYYLQFVESWRKDVTVVDKELLRRSWYYGQLQTKDKQILDGIQPLVKGFKHALVPFERGENFNPQLLEKYYRSIQTGLVSTNINARSVYILPELIDNEMRREEFSLPAGFSIAPEWFGYKVVKGKDYLPAELPNFKIRFPAKEDHYAKFVKDLISEMLAKRALYELAYGKSQKAKEWTIYLKKFNPSFLLPTELLNLFSQARQ